MHTSWIDSLGLNPRQLQGATHRDGPLLILAGAGSGKTRVITTRIAWLISECGISPASILSMTFTNKAAREMQSRVLQFLPGLSRKNRMTSGTFHAFCVQLLRRKIALLGYRDNFSIISTGDRERLITDIMKELKVDLTLIQPNEIEWKISDAKNALIHPGTEAANFFEDDLLCTIYRMYQTQLKGFNVIDLDDLLMLAVDLFEAAPEEMQAHCARWRYILVDEYQDTNQAQYRLLRALTQAHNNICVVGDDDQSIYSWRGADINNILNFEKDFPGSLVIRLEQNYRSTNNILRAANSLIAHNRERKGKNLWSSGGDGAPVHILPCCNEGDEAESILSRIFSLRREEGAEYRDIAIVFRTNFQTRPFEELFLSHSVPYEVIGGSKFFDRAEVRDIISYLRLMANRYDEMALMRVINRPKRRIGPQTVEKLLAWAEGESLRLYDALLRVDEINTIDSNTAYSIQCFCELIEEYAKKIFSSRSMADVVRDFIQDSGYDEELLREAGTDIEKYHRSRRWLQELCTSIQLFENDEGLERHDLYAYLEHVSLFDADKEDDDKEKLRNALTLITMHACKGLEFPYVFISGVTDGSIPHARSIELGSVEEERRLFYVAMTRAMKRLFIAYPSSRQRYGSEEDCVPSRFLEEIDPQTLLWAEASGADRNAPVEGTNLMDAFERMRARRTTRK
jgi:DNA helicase-2/ATP-dependent DNA helicase PcrA